MSEFSELILSEAGDTRARYLRKFSNKFSRLCVNEQYPSNMTLTHYHRHLLENLNLLTARMSPV